MRLLIVTVSCDPNHSYAGHVPSWVASIAHHCESVDVIAVQTAGTPPPNVRYYSLGKERGRSRVGRWVYFLRLLARLIWRNDAVFAMFSTSFVFGTWPFAFALRKPLTFWWAHGATPRTLRLADRLVARVLTSSAHGYRIPSTKVRIVGQGIPTNVYIPEPERRERPFTIITVGRLLPVKRFEDLVAAAALMVRRDGLPFKVVIVGATEHGEVSPYQQKIRQQIMDAGLSDIVSLEGDIPQARMPQRYQDADVMVNLGETGSMDKVVLEAMAAGLPVLSANEAYATLLGKIEPRLVVDKRQPEQLADRLHWLAEMPYTERRSLGLRLREIVVQDHSIDALGRRIVEEIEATRDHT